VTPVRESLCGHCFCRAGPGGLFAAFPTDPQTFVDTLQGVNSSSHKFFGMNQKLKTAQC
jgi:hypothetical protein